MTTELELAERLAAAAAGAPDRLGVSLAELRRRGRRRRQARIGFTSAAAAAVLAAAGGTAVALAGGGTPAVVGAPPSTAAAKATVSASPEAGSVVPVDPIETDEDFAGGKLTLWFGEQDDHFFLALGTRDATKKLALTGVTNDPEVQAPGPGGPGFHAGWEVDAGDHRLLVGYVVGDVAKVTLTVDGSPATAQVRAWSNDPSVHVWWLRIPGGNGTPAQVRALTGTNAAGTVVASAPDGGIAVG